MKNTLKFIAVAAIAVTMSGCGVADALTNTGVSAATNQAGLAESQINLATYAPTKENRDEVIALCENIASHRESRNAAWETFKGIGGLALRTVGVVATAAGYPVAGAIDLVTDVVGETEKTVDEVSKANSALVTSNKAKCAEVGIDV